MMELSRIFRNELLEVLPRCGDVDLDERCGDLSLGIETAVPALAVTTTITTTTLLGGGHDHHDVCIAGEQVDERRKLRIPHLHALHSTHIHTQTHNN